MSVYEINGGKKLDGSIEIQGAKNSVLPILAAAFLINGKSIIHNCPDLSDVDTAIKILVSLGCVCVRDADTVIVDSTAAANSEIPDDLMNKMRSSVLFLGAVVSRMNKAKISLPGGCELGPRPIDMHLKALEKLGINIKTYENIIECNAADGIAGNNIYLDFASVGATENIIIAAAVSKGITKLYGAAKEPEISDLADFLNSAGAKIYGAGSDTIIIEGVKKLHSTEHTVIADRIAAATYLSAAAITGGSICIKKTNPSYFVSILKFFKNIGCDFYGHNKEIYLKSVKNLSFNKELKTGVYPAFPTDAGPLVIPLLCKIKGESCLCENVFENRFRFIDELKHFGADVLVKDKKAFIKGNSKFEACDVSCTDLRGGAALVIAGLAANGVSHIDNLYHIERGYCNLPGFLRKLGADIKEV